MRRRYRFKAGDVVVSTREIRTMAASLPAGTRWTIVRRFKGYEVHSDPCPRCGIRMFATRCEDWMFEAAS